MEIEMDLLFLLGLGAEVDVESSRGKKASAKKEWTSLDHAEMKPGKYLEQIHRPKGGEPTADQA